MDKIKIKRWDKAVISPNGPECTVREINSLGECTVRLKNNCYRVVDIKNITLWEGAADEKEENIAGSQGHTYLAPIPGRI